jgi:beta-lactamase regulating signal transducer with metallopeptidase domain
MLWWLAQNTVTAGLLACLVVALCRLRRFSPAVQHVLWLVVLVKLLTPPLIAWPWAVPDPFPAETIALSEETTRDLEAAASAGDPQDAAVVMLEQAIVDLSVEKLALEARAAVDVPEAASTPQEVASHDSPPTTHHSRLAWLGSCLLYLWLAGTAFMVLVQWRRIASFHRRLAGGYPGPGWLLRLVRSLGSRLRVALPRPVVVPGSGSPLVWCLGRPQLVWPEDLLDRLPAESRRGVVAHELAHLKRRDHWVGWLLLLAECLWWWNPLFWWVRRQVRHHAELACDAWVVSTLPDDRRAYAEALIDVSQWISTAALPLPALGMGHGPRQAFTERLTMIMRDATPCRVPRFGLLAVGVLALVVIPGWSLAQKADEKKVDVRKVITTPAGDGERAVILLSDGPEGQEKKVIKLVVEGEEQQATGTARSRTAQDARDAKLEALEAKLQALLKEIRALRGAPATAATDVKYRAITVPQKPVIVEVQPKNVELKARVIEVPAKNVELKARVIEVPEKNMTVHVDTVPSYTARGRTTTAVTAHSPEVMAAIKKAIAALQAAGKKAEAEELMKAFESMHRIEIHAQPQSSVPAKPTTVTATAQLPATAAVARPMTGAVVRPPAASAVGVQDYRSAVSAAPLASYYRSVTRSADGELLLSRKTYKLENKAKAEALGAFLKDNVKASIMEIKVDGDSLTITTTPETQKAIGQLMNLTKGDGKTKTSALHVEGNADLRILADYLDLKLEPKSRSPEKKSEPRP